MSPDYSQEVLDLYRRLDEEAETAGYHLSPDREGTLILVEGLYRNQERYGYRLCPCRLGEGEKQRDLDVICPCDYRDADLDEYGQCYWALYVSQEVLEGKKNIGGQIPERRPEPEKLEEVRAERESIPSRVEVKAERSISVWRCRVCGYLCARDGPPAVCPICKAERDRFEEFFSTGAWTV